MSASAGRVLLIPKGTYDAATTYEMLDLVRYGKSTFVCKKTSTGNTPDSNQDTEYWQLIATSGDVSGVKGNAEATYREGNVNLTFADLGIDSALSSTSDNAVKNKAVYAALGTKQDILTFDTAPTSNSTNPVTSDGIKTALDGKLSATSDTTTNVTSFTSSDDSTSTDKTSDGMTEVITMTSGESHSSLFQKISKMFLNIRKLWNTVGSTAIDTAYGTTLTAQMANLKTYNTYSTSETWTGKYYVDSNNVEKKIYSKIIRGTFPSSGNEKLIDSTLTNSAVKIFNAWGTISNSSGGVYVIGYGYGSIYASSSAEYVARAFGLVHLSTGLRLDKTGYSNGDVNNQPYEVTVEYTKTT